MKAYLTATTAIFGLILLAHAATVTLMCSPVAGNHKRTLNPL